MTAFAPKALLESDLSKLREARSSVDTARVALRRTSGLLDVSVLLIGRGGCHLMQLYKAPAEHQDMDMFDDSGFRQQRDGALEAARAAPGFGHPRPISRWSPSCSALFST